MKVLRMQISFELGWYGSSLGQTFRGLVSGEMKVLQTQVGLEQEFLRF